MENGKEESMRRFVSVNRPSVFDIWLLTKLGSYPLSESGNRGTFLMIKFQKDGL